MKYLVTRNQDIPGGGHCTSAGVIGQPFQAADLVEYRATTVREFPMSLRKPKRRKLRLTKGDENDLEPGL